MSQKKKEYKQEARYKTEKNRETIQRLRDTKCESFLQDERVKRKERT